MVIRTSFYHTNTKDSIFILNNQNYINDDNSTGTPLEDKPIYMIGRNVKYKKENV